MRISIETVINGSRTLCKHTLSKLGMILLLATFMSGCTTTQDRKLTRILGDIGGSILGARGLPIILADPIPHSVLPSYELLP